MFYLHDPNEEFNHYYDNLNSRMYEYSNEFLSKLETLVHKLYVKEFACILINEWFEESKEAYKIADALDIGMLHFLAFSNDRNAFEENFIKEMELYEDFD